MNQLSCCKDSCGSNLRRPENAPSFAMPDYLRERRAGAYSCRKTPHNKAFFDETTDFREEMSPFKIRDRATANAAPCPTLRLQSAVLHSEIVNGNNRPSLYAQKPPGVRRLLLLIFCFLSRRWNAFCVLLSSGISLPDLPPYSSRSRSAVPYSYPPCKPCRGTGSWG